MMKIQYLQLQYKFNGPPEFWACFTSSFDISDMMMEGPRKREVPVC